MPAVWPCLQSSRERTTNTYAINTLHVDQGLGGPAESRRAYRGHHPITHCTWCLDDLRTFFSPSHLADRETEAQRWGLERLRTQVHPSDRRPHCSSRTSPGAPMGPTCA